jgi:creatinine amidohydrolase
VVLPPLAYGVTRFARNFPGTISVSAEVVTGMVAEVLQAALAAGARRVAIVNAHFEPANVDALFAAKARVPEIVFPHLGSRKNAARLRAAVLDGHAGLYETSLMLALAPQLVHGHAALVDNDADLAAGILAGATCFEEAGGPDAFFGRPGAATTETGHALLDELATIVVEALDA